MLSLFILSDVDERRLERRDVDKDKDLEEFEWFVGRRVEGAVLDRNQKLRDRTRHKRVWTE